MYGTSALQHTGGILFKTNTIFRTTAFLYFQTLCEHRTHVHAIISSFKQLMGDYCMTVVYSRTPLNLLQIANKVIDDGESISFLIVSDGNIAGCVKTLDHTG